MVYKRSANDFEQRLGSFVCIASWKSGVLRAIESTVIVITSDLLTVCVPKFESAATLITSELLSVCVANLYELLFLVPVLLVFPAYLRINLNSPLSCVLDSLHHTPTERFL
ncbi:hypothetical protein AVEN_5922-1 [Araneus ventricosus]|uniref:Uncharacterized protein n=1 Tax=Araneus ventricosus TaxID=182803 RepID=A0A4Y2F039_ARAVE|nr:hypothetical protein AVEN_5922-1 [Araneus ventricosus]